MIVFLFFILTHCAFVSQSNRDKEYTKNKIYYIQRHLDELNGYKKFTEKNAEVKLEMKDCYPIEIKELINNVTIIYSMYDERNLIESLVLDKLFRLLQNNIPFCRALQDSMNLYSNIMANRITNKPDESKSKKERYENLKVSIRCNDIVKKLNGLINEEFGSILSKGIECLRLTERKGTVMGYHEKTIAENNVL
jgi:hypothetical protein